MKKVEEHHFILPPTFEVRIHLLVSREGKFFDPIRPVGVRCKADILEGIAKIVGDKAKSKQVLELIENEFPGALSEERFIFEESSKTYLEIIGEQILRESERARSENRQLSNPPQPTNQS